MKSIIFDLDGTIADTSADLIAAANLVLKSKGCNAQLDFEKDKLVAFKGGRAMLRAGFAKLGATKNEVKINKELYQSFLKVYERGLSAHTKLYPGVTESLDMLISEGWRLGICTNKPERLAILLLKDLGIFSRFTSLIGADTLPLKKPHPVPLLRAITEVGGIKSRSILIGDTETDVKTARAAGVPVFLVSFGPQGAVAQTLNPDNLLEHYLELPRLAAEYIHS